MKTTNVLLGVLAGAAVGATLGILFAPDKGSETRKKISKKGEEYMDEVQVRIECYMEGLRNKSKSIQQNTEAIIEKGKSKVEDTYKEFKSNDSQAKSLQKADITI